nr:hypothetical protein [Trametes gibbosa]QIE48458.1 hypothetical protein [Trametes gibbosa]
MAPAQCTVCDARFKSKNECNIHRAYVGHGAPAVFFCVECAQTFAKLKELKNHRNTLGHTKTTLTVTSLEDVEKSLSHPLHIFDDRRPPSAVPEGAAPAVRTANCSTCHESFDTYHALAAHRRAAHGHEILVAFRCPRCVQEIPLGEVHDRCTPSVRAACTICRQRFGSTVELAQHRLANPMSCDICAVHLPQGQTLQEHWHLSNRHPYCKMCNNAFKNYPAWAAHTLNCSLARASLVPGAVGNPKEAQKQSLKQPAFDRNAFVVLRSSSQVNMDLAEMDGFLSKTIEPTSGQASRRSSHSSLSKVTESTAESSASSRDLMEEEDISNTKLAEEYGEENITRILSVVEDEEPADEPRPTKSLLSTSVRSSECDPSLLADCSTTWDMSRKADHANSPPMLGCRREPRKPVLDVDAWEISSDSPSEKVMLWLRHLSRHDLAKAPTLPHPLVTPDGLPRPKPGDVGLLQTSWQCRLCLRQPCAEPVTTSCGHFFCQSCILSGLKTYTGCPTCQTEYFVPLNPATTC